MRDAGRVGTPLQNQTLRKMKCPVFLWRSSVGDVSAQAGHEKRFSVVSGAHLLGTHLLGTHDAATLRQTGRRDLMILLRR